MNTTVLSGKNVSTLLRSVSLVAALLLTGCFETKDEVTLNPDGSGKVVHSTSFQPMTLGNTGDANPEAKLKSEVADILEKSEGVDAWSDVSYKLADDGKMQFRGTAYFPDINKLKLHQHAIIKLGTKKDASGNLVVEARAERKNDDEKPVAPKNLTEQQITAKIKEQRAQFQQQGKPMLVAIMGQMKHDVLVRLPGQVKTANNFKKTDAGVELNFEGAKLIAAMEKMIADDNFMRQQIKSGRSFSDGEIEDESAINEMVFGAKGPIQAVVATGAKPAFDYKAEVAKAKAQSAAVRKQLGLTSELAPPARGGTLKALKVVGVRLIRESDSKRELRPFNDEAGLSFAVQVNFPGSIIEVKGKLERAIADDGSDLTPENSWKRSFQFPKVSTDKTSALIEIDLSTPAPAVKGIKEIVGTLEYTTAAGTKNIDLGFTELKEKSQGTELQAVIKKIEPGFKKDSSETIELEIRTTPDQLVGLKLIDANGTEFPLNRRGYSGFNDKYTFTFEHKGKFPVNGKLVVETFDKLEKFDAPFKLENIDLLGQPK